MEKLFASSVSRRVASGKRGDFFNLPVAACCSCYEEEEETLASHWMVVAG